MILNYLYFETAIHLLEEILSLIYENNGIRLKRGTVASYFHENIYNLVLCTSTERFTSREVYFLSAASSKCKVLLIFFALISSILNKLHS